MILKTISNLERQEKNKNHSSNVIINSRDIAYWMLEQNMYFQEEEEEIKKPTMHMSNSDKLRVYM
jgi:hypothetical protein